MKTKTVVTIALLVFVGLSFGVLIVGELSTRSGRNVETQSSTEIVPLEPIPSGEAPSATETATPPAQTPEQDDDNTTGKANYKVVAYYFYGNKRCVSCQKIEAWTGLAIQEAFEDEIEKERLVWKPVNVDEPENNHFIKDYELVTKSVVLSKLKDGTQESWKNLDRVWELLQSQDRFIKYIQGEMVDFMGDDIK